ncbi:MAG: ATP-binding cassette domain-containing protein [Clostridiales Family XIII bacterium]|jgi:peptide/nickel transport system ATP-binding protein|nr:ATP-binding cassette domain-containing protein [Clostridiales Family XIII bacterium]
MDALVEIRRLKKYFDTPRGQLHAVDDVTMSFEKGTTMGVVGESGCGKSTLGRTIIHLLESTDGNIFFEGRDVTRLNSSQLTKLRHDMQIIFQDPFSSLNPRYTVEDTLKETLLRSKRATRKTLDGEIIKLMDMVGIARRLRMAYPHEMDGGRRQRVCIGRALSMDPKFIVCDEPVSALDVSIQAQVLNLLQDLQTEHGLTYMFVTHDLSVVRHMSKNISVMYLGQVVERCESDELFDNPLHPYTRALLSSIPSVDIHRKKERVIITGELTSPVNPKPGCRFLKRCPHAEEQCEKPQTLREFKTDHFVLCDRVEKNGDPPKRNL